MRRRSLLLVPAALAAAALAGGLGLHRNAATASAALPHVTARSGGAEVLAFSDAHPTGPARGALAAHLDHISDVAPAWLTLGANATFRYRVQDPFVAGLAERGAAVLPVLRDPDHRAGGLLADGPMRRRLALRLAFALRALRARGLVLDLGELPRADRRTYPAFLRELRRELGSRARLYATVPAEPSPGYDLRDLARPAVLVLRAWNEHDDRSGSGPVASLAWFKRAVRSTLARAPRSRVLVGIPTWGWSWTTHGARREAQAELFRRAGEARLQAPDGAHVGLPDGTAWVESDRSVQLKLEVARAAHVRGVAIWIRGGESAGLWRQPLIG